MKKPMPEEFGLTNQEYKYLVAERTRLSEALDRQPSYGPWIVELFLSFFEALMLSLAVSWFIVGLGGAAGALVGWVLEIVVGLREALFTSIYIGIIIGVCGLLIVFIILLIVLLTEPYRENRERAQYRKQLSNPKYRNVELYEEATRRYEYRQQTYWKSLKGRKFEKSLARLYRNMGYSVQQTKGSGDEGIDLILVKEGTKTIVQCKGHKKPVGVGAVRDLYGAMMHFGADSSVLACPAGFTKGVVQFVTDKPIQLVSVSELVEIAESIGQEK